MPISCFVDRTHLKKAFLHTYCILTSVQAKHAIPKKAEFAYSIGQLGEEIA